MCISQETGKVVDVYAYMRRGKLVFGIRNIDFMLTFLRLIIKYCSPT